MNRIEVLEKIIRQEGRCMGIVCLEDKCPLSQKYGNSGCYKGNGNKDNLALATEMLAKEKEVKFEIGNEVKWNGNRKLANGVSLWKEMEHFLESRETHIIKDIDTDNTCKLVGDNNWHSLDWLELVDTCNLIKNKEYEFGDDYGSWFKEKFHSYDDSLESPYLSLDEDGVITNWKIFREVQPQYKAYTEPKLEWIKKRYTVKIQGREYKIVNIGYINDEYRIRLSDGYDYNLKHLFNHYTWSDGTPFGELIK